MTYDGSLYDHPPSHARRDATERFWRHVMGRAYRALPQGADLTPLEIAGLRDVPRSDQTEAVRLNEGTRWEEPFGPTRAIEYGERLAKEQLP